MCQVNGGDITTYRQSYECEARRRGKGEEPRSRSREEHRRKDEKGSERKMAYLPKNEHEQAIQLPDAEERFGKFVLITSTTT